MTKHEVTKVKIDDRILKYLQTNPKITRKELAEKLGVARATCTTAISRLENAGLILGTGFLLPVSSERVLSTIDGFVLISSPYKPEKKRDLEAVFAKYIDVGQAHMVTGGEFNYLFSFFVPLKSEIFVTMIEEIMEFAKTETHTVVKSM